MILVKRILFTIVYLLITLSLIFYTEIPPVLVVLVAIVFSGFISRNGILAGLGKYIDDRR